MEAVKEFCKNAGGYSMQKLQGSVRSLQDAVKVGGELTPQAVNALISKLGGFWSKYSDSALQSGMKEVVILLLQNYREPAYQALATVLVKHSKNFNRISGSVAEAKMALVELKLASLLLQYAPDTGITFQLLQTISTLLAPVVASKMKDKARKWVEGPFSSSPALLKQCLQVILGASTFSPILLPLLDVIFRYYTTSKLDFPNEEYAAVMERFVKSVLNNTVRPDYVLLQSSVGIFKKVTRQMFKDVLFPGMLKALLRNPDELTRAVALVVSGVPIDLSQFAEKLLENCTPLLGSQNPDTRQDAQTLIDSLARQCSDASAPPKAISLFSQALKSGASGKVTVAEHRLSVLTAVGSLVQCPLSSAGQQEVATQAAKMLAAHIKQEVHAGTALAAANVLKRWCALLPPGSKETVTFIKTSFTGKTTPPLMRVAYLWCMLALCQEEREPSLVPLPLQSLERVAATPSPQSPALEEAVAAIHVAIKVSFPDPIPPQAWALAESHAEQLVSSKLLTAASQESLVALVKVAQALLSADTVKLKEATQRVWLRGVARVLLQSPWETRQVAVKCVSEVVLLRPVVAEWMLEDLEEVAEKGDFPSKPLLIALISLATPTHPRKNTLAVKGLLLAHHPSISAVNPGVWTALLKHLQLEPSPFIASSSQELVSALTSNMATKPRACMLALRSLLTQHAEGVAPLLVTEVCQQLGNQRILEATQQDWEIMNTSEGELWHTGMRKELEAAVAGGPVSTANMKKESKAYSYEDQKWEVEMRQEIMRKRRAEAGQSTTATARELIKKAKLSEKQRQSIETQLADEEATRSCLLALSERLGHIVDLVGELKGDIILPHVPQLSGVTHKAFSSPLAHPHCRKLWAHLAHSVFEEWTLAQLFTETSICTLTSRTTPPALSRVLSLLADHTPESLERNSASHTLTLSLSQHVLLSCDPKAVAHDLRECAVLVLNKAVDKYVSAVTEGSSVSGFPVSDTLQLLSDVLATGDDSPKMAKVKKCCVSMFISLLSPTLCQQPPILPILRAALLQESPLLRSTALQALADISPPFVPQDPHLLVGVVIAQNSEKESDRKLARGLCDGASFEEPLVSDLSELLIQQCSRSSLVMQTSTALALGAWLEKHPDRTATTLDTLVATYNTKKSTPPPKKDSFGRDIFIEYRDQWEGRVGVAKALEQLSEHAESEEALKFLKFVIPGALSDPNPKVQSAMMAAAQAAIGCHGDMLAGELMSHSEESLKSIPDSQEADVVRQCIIVLMGTLARHMDKENPKVKSVLHLLLSNLDTPSQQVQEAIARCLPPLASVVKPDAEDIIKKLLNKLLESTNYSQRKGAAYGLAGLVKGLGIPTLKQYQVMTALQEAIVNKKNYRHREGALLAFESLCNMLGRLFEPYVVHLLPELLVCFGDGNQYVREATDQTARTIMAHLSSHGVKLILPSLLTALEEDSWRTKAGSAELLGAMAFCAPKQLSSCLPGIVPRLMDVLADSHSKVQAAGSQALKQIGSVIKNPEIQQLVPVLLEGLSDPSNMAQTCLQALLETEFVHVIDPPSLALIMPTLKRTLEVRSTDTKKMAAQIIGNMYSLTDKKDLAPYLPDVLPGLKMSLVDPVPEVRTVCAKALGAITRGMGSDGLGELLPWLMSTLKSEGTSVDRSGAAQGISEVLFSQGKSYLEEVLPQFVAAAQDTSSPPHVRDGYLMLFVYLPMTFGDQMCSFIGTILPCILKGLADESEFVRETSLQAGQTVVNRYADTAVELFLPQLESGLFDDNWRIRCSSIQLLGDLLYKISGLSGKMSTESEEDDNFGTEAAHKTLLKSLGRERRDRVFAGLYMGRSDVALIVRQTSLHVWKVVVTNTARTLREILPTLIHLLLGCLASQSPDKRKVAARTLGDLVRKLGERVLPEVIPMLEEGLNSDTAQERQGVCIGLSEIIQQTSRDNVLLYMESILPTVQNALCDQQSEVRAAAALTFDSLHSTVGSRVLDDVLSPLLSDLSSPTSGGRSEVALDGLRQVMAVKSRVVLPHIVPQLIRPPVNVRALALLTSVAGESLNKHLNRIIPALIDALVGSQDQEVWQSAEEVVLSVHKEPGPAFLIEELVKCCRDIRPEVRATAMQLLHVMCKKSRADLTEHIPMLMIFTTEALNDPSDRVCEEAWMGLEALVKRVNPKELPHFTGYLRKGLRTVSAKLTGDELRGFGLKGITPALTLLKEGLINGSPDEKEEAAHVLVEVIHLASPKTLSAGKVVMLIAGPLIRVLGDRYGWNVKVATLEALVELVRKVGVAAKAFIPQLQTSYLKALNDPNKPVRVMAVTGLTELLPLSPRVDPVFNDLHNGIKKSEDTGLRLTMLQALHGVVKVGGERMSEKHRDEILATLVTLQGTAQEVHRLEAAQCVGSLCAYLSDTQLHSTLATHVLDHDGISDWGALQARATTLSAALLVASSRITALGLRGVVMQCVISMATSDRVPVCVSGLQCIGSFVNHMEGDGKEMLPPLAQGLVHSSVDIRVAACDVCAELLSPSDSLLTSILPQLLLNTKEKNTAVKSAAELALYKLIQGEAHLKYVCSLLDGSTSRKLEETYQRILAKH